MRDKRECRNCRHYTDFDCHRFPTTVRKSVYDVCGEHEFVPPTPRYMRFVPGKEVWWKPWTWGAGHWEFCADNDPGAIPETVALFRMLAECYR